MRTPLFLLDDAPADLPVRGRYYGVHHAPNREPGLFE
jgi:hypothetical protein